MQLSLCSVLILSVSVSVSVLVLGSVNEPLGGYLFLVYWKISQRCLLDLWRQSSSFRKLYRNYLR